MFTTHKAHRLKIKLLSYIRILFYKYETYRKIAKHEKDREFYKRHKSYQSNETRAIKKKHGILTEILLKVLLKLGSHIFRIFIVVIPIIIIILTLKLYKYIYKDEEYLTNNYVFTFKDYINDPTVGLIYDFIYLILVILFIAYWVRSYFSIGSNKGLSYKDKWSFGISLAILAVISTTYFSNGIQDSPNWDNDITFNCMSARGLTAKNREDYLKIHQDEILDNKLDSWYGMLNDDFDLEKLREINHKVQRKKTTEKKKSREVKNTCYVNYYTLVNRQKADFFFLVKNLLLTASIIYYYWLSYLFFKQKRQRYLRIERKSHNSNIQITNFNI